MISIVSTNFRMSGSYINHLDTQQFLSKDFEVNYYYDDRETPLWKMLLETKRLYTIQNPIKIKKVIEDDIIITDVRGLIVLTKEGHELNCDKLIVFDCAELTYHLKNLYDAPMWLFWLDYSYKDSIYEYLDFNAKDIQFLMPPSNFKIFVNRYPDLDAKIFFKKINLEVIKKRRNKYFKNDITYSRRPEVLWHEQMGRRVFEFLLTGNKVTFGNDPFMIRDGFSDYLEYYNIGIKNGTATADIENLRGVMNEPYNFTF